MICDQCGARRSRTGPCPECGAPPPGTYSSMRQWKDQARTGEGPAVGRDDGARGSGASWGPAGAGGAGSSNARNRSGGSGAGWRSGSGSRWNEGESDDGYADGESDAPGRSAGRAPRRPAPQYQEIDLERALVPTRNGEDMGYGGLVAQGMDGMGGMQMGPLAPTTDEEERALGIRRPVYIPATSEKRKRRLGTWRVLSGVLSVMLVCVAGCGLSAALARNQIANLFIGPKTNHFAPAPFSTANVPVTPVATAGASKLAGDVTEVVTATGKDQLNNPQGPTSHFLAGNYVYVTMLVRNLPAGSHIISVRWYFAGQYLELGANAHTTYPIQHDARVAFGLQFPNAGAGSVRIYIDRPADQKSDTLSDPTLVATINFAVEEPTPTAAPTKAGGTATPNGTQTPSASPSPKAAIGAEPVAWRERPADV